MFHFLPLSLLKLLFQDILGILPVGSPLTSSISSSITSSLAATPPSPAGTSSIPGMNANALPFYPTSDTVESVIGNFAIFPFLLMLIRLPQTRITRYENWNSMGVAENSIFFRCFCQCWQIAEAVSFFRDCDTSAGHYRRNSPPGPTEGL